MQTHSGIFATISAYNLHTFKMYSCADVNCKFTVADSNRVKTEKKKKRRSRGPDAKYHNNDVLVFRALVNHHVSIVLGGWGGTCT